MSATAAAAGITGNRRRNRRANAADVRPGDSEWPAEARVALRERWWLRRQGRLDGRLGVPETAHAPQPVTTEMRSLLQRAHEARLAEVQQQHVREWTLHHNAVTQLEARITEVHGGVMAFHEPRRPRPGRRNPAAWLRELASGRGRRGRAEPIGLGATCAPQRSAPYDVTERLKAIWQAILQAGNATVGFDPSSFAVSAPGAGLPPVTPVSFESPSLPTTGWVKLREDQVGFVPGQATFRDEHAAREALSAIAAKLSASQLHATVMGTAALPGDQWLQPSQDRADAAVTVPESFGLSKSVLTAVGVGVHFNGFVPDTNADGVLIETKAVQNRLAIIEPVGVQCA